MKIAVIPGDGIGPDIAKQTYKVLDRVSEAFNMKFAISKYIIKPALATGIMAICSYSIYRIPNDLLHMFNHFRCFRIGRENGFKTLNIR